MPGMHIPTWIKTAPVEGLTYPKSTRFVCTRLTDISASRRCAAAVSPRKAASAVPNVASVQLIAAETVPKPACDRPSWVCNLTPVTKDPTLAKAPGCVHAEHMLWFERTRLGPLETSRAVGWLSYWVFRTRCLPLRVHRSMRMEFRPVLLLHLSAESSLFPSFSSFCRSSLPNSLTERGKGLAALV